MTCLIFFLLLIFLIARLSNQVQPFEKKNSDQVFESEQWHNWPEGHMRDGKEENVDL